MIYGDNRVEEYSTVQAFSVEPANARVISGGSGEDITVTEGTTFFWVYDPTGATPSGFTGTGWYNDTPNSPICVSGISIKEIEDGFANETRTNLNDVFSAWQSFVNQHAGEGIVSDFVTTLVNNGGGNCWSMG